MRSVTKDELRDCSGRYTGGRRRVCRYPALSAMKSEEVSRMSIFSLYIIYQPQLWLENTYTYAYDDQERGRRVSSIRTFASRARSGRAG